MMGLGGRRPSPRLSHAGADLNRLMWDAGAVTVYRIRFEGPAALAVGVATSLADADGVELTSSAQPSILDENTVELTVSVDGTRDAVAIAVSRIDDTLPDGASIEIV